MRFIVLQFKEYLEWRIDLAQLRANLAHMSEGEHTVTVGVTESGLCYACRDMTLVCHGRRVVNPKRSD